MFDTPQFILPKHLIAKWMTENSKMLYLRSKEVVHMYEDRCLLWISRSGMQSSDPPSKLIWYQTNGLIPYLSQPDPWQVLAKLGSSSILTPASHLIAFYNDMINGLRVFKSVERQQIAFTFHIQFRRYMNGVKKAFIPPFHGKKNINKKHSRSFHR